MNGLINVLTDSLNNIVSHLEGFLHENEFTVYHDRAYCDNFMQAECRSKINEIVGDVPSTQKDDLHGYICAGSVEDPFDDDENCDVDYDDIDDNDTKGQMKAYCLAKDVGEAINLVCDNMHEAVTDHKINTAWPRSIADYIKSELYSNEYKDFGTCYTNVLSVCVAKAKELDKGTNKLIDDDYTAYCEGRDFGGVSLPDGADYTIDGYCASEVAETLNDKKADINNLLNAHYESLYDNDDELSGKGDETCTDYLINECEVYLDGLGITSMPASISSDQFVPVDKDEWCAPTKPVANVTIDDRCGNLKFNCLENEAVSRNLNTIVTNYVNNYINDWVGENDGISCPIQNPIESNINCKKPIEGKVISYLQGLYSTCNITEDDGPQVYLLDEDTHGNLIFNSWGANYMQPLYNAYCDDDNDICERLLP
jgi:hypothetical protein